MQLYLVKRQCLVPRGFAVPRRKLYFDETTLDTNVLDVLEAAALLEITEFRLFHIAYDWWHGSTTSDEAIERYYLPYMFRDRVPAWVRHFARHVIARDEAGDLDATEFGIMPRPVSMDMYNKGLRHMLCLIVIFGALLTGAAAVARLSPWYQACYFPPCY